MPVSFRLLPFLIFALGIFACVRTAHGQTIKWATNFYPVTGANFREIRQSIAKSRPWKDGFDGDTRWAVKWQFTSTQNADGCFCTSFSTTTTITTTLPRWTPPTNALSEVKTQWTRYFTNLARHEIGHARIGIAAATELQRQIRELSAQRDCETLNRAVNNKAETVVNDYRESEKEYDRRTEHGTRAAAAASPKR